LRSVGDLEKWIMELWLQEPKRQKRILS
jgi:hypothetical protein